MLFLGHIAVTLKLADATGADPAAAVAGNLLPDLVDKSARRLRLFPSGRWLAHGLPAVLLTSLLVGRMTTPHHRRSFALGYLGHLVCDLYLGGRVPWFIPLRRYTPKEKEQRSVLYWLLYLLPELIGAAVIAQRSAAPATSDTLEAQVTPERTYSRRHSGIPI